MTGPASRHLLVIGGQRCGTTSLHHLLDAHPEITMARPARPEPKVFCSDEATDRGAEWYRRTFFAHARDEAVLGDKSTSYIEDPQAPARAARMLGTPYVVALLRDPVRRAISNWRFSTDSGLETRPLEAALRENLASSAPWDPITSSVSPFAYLERGRYAGQLRPWLEQFPRTTHVLFLDDLVGGPDSLAQLFAALGVRTDVRPDGPDPVTEPVNRSSSPAPELPADLVGELRDHYADSDRDLAALLGREVPWRRTSTPRSTR